MRLILLLCCLWHAVDGRISTLDIDMDSRRLFAVETFGFLVGGVHKMALSNLEAL